MEFTSSKVVLKSIFVKLIKITVYMYEYMNVCMYDMHEYSCNLVGNFC